MVVGSRQQPVVVARNARPDLVPAAVFVQRRRRRVVGQPQPAVVVGNGVGGRIAGRVEFRGGGVLGIEPGLLELPHGVLAGRAVDVDVAAAETCGGAVLGACRLAGADWVDDDVLGRDDVDVELVYALAAAVVIGVAVPRGHRDLGVRIARHIELEGAGGRGAGRQLAVDVCRRRLGHHLDFVFVVDVDDALQLNYRLLVGNVGRDVLVRPLELDQLTRRPGVGAVLPGPAVGIGRPERECRILVAKRDRDVRRNIVLGPGLAAAGAGLGYHLRVEVEFGGVVYRARSAVLALVVEVDVLSFLGKGQRREGNHNARGVVLLHLAGDGVLEVEYRHITVLLVVGRKRYPNLQRVAGADGDAGRIGALRVCGYPDREEVVGLAVLFRIVGAFAFAVKFDVHRRHIADGHGKGVLVVAEEVRVVRIHVAVLQPQGDGLDLLFLDEGERCAGNAV